MGFRGLCPDHSGLSRAGKRAGLLVMQGSRCALCGTPRPTEADHNHDTGFLRGLLCKSCNMQCGRGFGRLSRRTQAYLTYPPALALHWIWAVPDWWSGDDSDVLWQSGVTIADYVLALSPDEIDRRAGVLTPAEDARWRDRSLARP